MGHHMIKTTMAEAVRARSQETKTKPKKSKSKSKTTNCNQPGQIQEATSTILLDSEQAVSSRDQHEIEKGTTASENEVYSTEAVLLDVGTKKDSNLEPLDLETDGEGLMQASALAHIRQDEEPGGLENAASVSVERLATECDHLIKLDVQTSLEDIGAGSSGAVYQDTGQVLDKDAEHGSPSAALQQSPQVFASSSKRSCAADILSNPAAKTQVLEDIGIVVECETDDDLLLESFQQQSQPCPQPAQPQTLAAEIHDTDSLTKKTSVVTQLLDANPLDSSSHTQEVLSEPHVLGADLSDMPSSATEALALQPSLESEHTASSPESVPLTDQSVSSTALSHVSPAETSVEDVLAHPVPPVQLSTDVIGSTEATACVESVSSSAPPCSLYPKVPLLESPVEGKFQPMSSEQLQLLYYNPELQANSRFLEEFVQNEEKKTSHEFHDIVMNYYRSRKSLLSVEEDLKLLKQNYDRIFSELWIFHEKHVTVMGQCADGSRVSKVYTYEQCELNKDAVSNMATTLQSIRNEVQNDLALFAYSSQMSRLQVESYLYQLFVCCPLLRDLPGDTPVSATDHVREELSIQVEKLKECISVLFGFHRRPAQDSEFVENIRKWTEQLVAVLLRTATYKDHLFLLNHILRSPAGVGKWASHFVQIPGPASLTLQTTLGSPMLDHAVTCLATVLLPIRAREQFMLQMKINMSESSQMEQTWTLVDSDGEEDEDPSQTWLYLHENDVVSILHQFPLFEIFTHLLQTPVDENGIVHYDVKRYTEPTMMKLFAFCTTWISLLGAGLNTYSMARYRQLNKRLGRLIRQTIAFVSDHWLNFKTYYGPLASSASLDHLQLEFDQLFIRATYTILTAQKLGSWQFMADMPFTCLSAGSVWRLLWLLQQGQGQPVELHKLPPVEKCKEDMKDIESRRQLADALQTLPTSESIYLLTTFANMAAARPLEEDEFIECITLQIFEIAYICDHTRDLCSKIGRDLLSSVIQKHPTALSILLRRVQAVIRELGTMSLYLFSGLPASIWIPQDPDMLLLRQWLLNNDLNTVENQLACVVLDRMNWDLFTETGKLVLDIRLHRQAALLLIEAYVKFISDRRASFFIIEGMKQMASYAYSSQLPREQQFSNWAWAIALRLKLHREASILHSRAAESHPFQAPSLEQEPWLLPMAAAARNKNPLACFLVLTMTDIGHDAGQFISVGLDMLMTLAMSSQYSAVIHVLSCVTPLFASSPQYLLENETFQKILQLVLSADESVLKITKQVMGAEFKVGTVTQQFTQMIQAMISARLDSSEALSILVFWVQAIFKVAHFLTDQNCCYVLDHLVRWGYLQKGARDKLDTLFKQYQQLQMESKSRGGFLNWMAGSSATTPSLMERTSMPEFGWLATQVLHMEDISDQESGFWPAFQQELFSRPTVAVEVALKQVLAQMKPEHPHVIGRLGIYRWAQQALDMPVNHPMMPIVWQKFFTLYLGRCTQQTHRIPTRASVGERFFQSMSMSSMLRRMKKKLAEAADFHLKYDLQTSSAAQKEDSPVRLPISTSSDANSEANSPLSSPSTEENSKYSSSTYFHQQLAKLYQTLSLWLEEPRLHGADLYLPALPPQYEAARLMHIFTPGNSPWLEFVDFDGAQYEISLFAAEWRKLVSDRPQFGPQSPTRRHNTLLPDCCTATERILQRLQRYPSPAAPPSLQQVFPPVPDISPAMLSDKLTAIHLLDADLGVLKEFTKFFSTRAAQQCALDGAFLDLIPGQYSNVVKQAKVIAECRSRVNPLHRCSGPNVIPIRVEEREMNAVVQRKLDENRAEYKQLMIEAVLPPPQNVCIATVHVENAITQLIKLSQGTTDSDIQAALFDVACTLFYHLTVQVNEETNFYPPTKQFFASCVEILGKEFVSSSPSQAPLLLRFSLDNPSLASMVAPHFVPNNASENFVTMYEQLIVALQQQNLHLVFMLLTKFDVRIWLEKHRPSAADKKRFLEVLGSALMSCGVEPSANIKLVFDLYLAHLRCILHYQFPTHLSSVLSLLLQGSSSEDLHTSCWEMLLMECCNNTPGTEAGPGAQIISWNQVESGHTIPLSTEQLQELLHWLGMFFNHQRRTDPDLYHFGLYPRWGRYIPYLSLLMGLLSRNFVAKVLVSLQEQNPFQALQVVWHQHLDLWQAWMEPLPPVASSRLANQVASAGDLMQPWTEGDITVAVTMVDMFKSVLLFMHDTLANVTPQCSNTVFSLMLMHYITKLSVRTTPPHVSDVLVAEFATLPWERLDPDLQLVETMAQLKEHSAAACFQLIGHIMPKVDWAEVITAFKVHQDPQVARRMQAAILLLLVQCYGDVFIREIPEMTQLLLKAEQFDWAGLTVDAYRSASFWFLQVCQPEWVLAQRSSLPALGFRLMKAAAEFTPNSDHVWTAEISIKRLTYVHCMTQQLCQVTYLPKVDLEALSTVLVNLLSEVEAMESAVSDVRCQEEESLDLMKEMLGLLNNSNPDGDTQGFLLKTFRQWLHSSPHSILLTPCIKAASRCLASLTQLVQITETCIQVYFSAYSKDKAGGTVMTLPALAEGWEHILAVFQLPELNVDQYVEEAIRCGSYLLLYVLLLHKRPLCQSLDDEAKLMKELLNWSVKAVPTSEDEAKLLLWWLEFGRMWLRQLDFSTSTALCVDVARNFVVLLHQLGEDRASTGFLGVIGFGKRSQLSPEFRIAVRTIAAFLSSQILSETSVRVQPTSSLSELPMAKQCRAALSSMRGNKLYVSQKDHVENMVEYVHNTAHTARHVVDLIRELAITLYHDCDYLAASF